jgi:hypothetical protein
MPGASSRAPGFFDEGQRLLRHRCAFDFAIRHRKKDHIPAKVSRQQYVMVSRHSMVPGITLRPRQPVQKFPLFAIANPTWSKFFRTVALLQHCF